MISIAGDFRGLQRAALELMEEMRLAPEREKVAKMMAAANTSDEVSRACYSERTLPEGYYARVGYLLELESLLSICQQPGFELDLTEVRGMLSIRAARAEFDRAHPQCRGCGVRLQNEWDKTCNDCQRAAAARGRAS